MYYDKLMWRQFTVKYSPQLLIFLLVKTELKNWKPLNRPTINLIYIHDKEKKWKSISWK